jgi:hypothetical protein
VFVGFNISDRLFTPPLGDFHQDLILEKLRGEKDVGPTYGFTASPEVGSGGHCRYLQTGYPRVYASGRDKGQGMRPRVAMCHRNSGTCLLAYVGLQRCHVSQGFRPRAST